MCLFFLIKEQKIQIFCETNPKTLYLNSMFIVNNN